MKSLKAIAGNTCTFEQVATQSAGTSGSDQRMTQLMAQESLYRMREQEYDSWASNIFTGKIIRPADLPATAPGLDQMKKEVCR
jgi:hypothetical protein